MSELCPKFSQDRGSAGGASYQRAAISRQGMHSQDAPTLKTAGEKNINLQPEPVNPPNFPNEESGMNPDVVSADTGDDAQDRQTEQDPIACETEPAEVVPTTAKPPEPGEDLETTPTVNGVENTPTGSVEEARYPALIEESHVVGYPGKAAR